MSQLFLVRLTPNANKIQANMEEKQSLSKGHHDFIDNLVAEKIIQFGGPMEGKPGGMLVVKGDSHEEITKIFADDPMIKNQYLNAEINMWTIKHGNYTIQ